MKEKTFGIFKGREHIPGGGGFGGGGHDLSRGMQANL